MLSNITIDDAHGNPVTLHETTGPPTSREIVSTKGLHGIPTPRVTKRLRPQGHGEINETRWTNGSVMMLEGQIASQVSQEAVWTDFYAVAAPMLQTLDNGPALLKWVNGSTGLALQKLVRLDGELEPQVSEGSAILDYHAQFFAEDPRAYSQTQTTATGGVLSKAAGGLTFNAPPPNLVVNPGFETGDTSGWTATATGGSTVTTFAARTGWAFAGTYSARLTASLAAYGQAQATSVAYIPVVGGATYLLAGQINVLTLPSGGNVTLYVLWYDSNHVLLSQPGTSTPYGTSPGVYSLAAPPFVAPANAAYALVQAVTIGNVGAGTGDIYFDNISLSNQSVSTGGLTFPLRFNPSGGGVVTCTNTGNRPTPAVFRIYGMCQSPQILLPSTGQRISLAGGTIAAGDHVDVIVGGPAGGGGVHQVLYNGMLNRQSFVDSPNTSWFELPIGTTNLQLLAPTFDGNARMDAIFNAAYS